MIPQGSFFTFDSNSPSPTAADSFLFNYWIWESIYQPRDPTFAYPAWVLSITTGCISVSLWFYNMILKSSGLHLLEWTIRTTKILIPTGSDDFSLHDSFLHDPPPIRWSRKSSRPPSFGRHWKLLAVLTALNGCLTQGQSHFQVKSEQEYDSHLRKYRSYQGELRSDKLNHQDLLGLQRRIQADDSHFKTATADHKHIFSAIVDTGCTHSCTNTFSDVDPLSIRKLNPPMKLDGIAGGVQVEFVGTVTWETLDDSGNIIPFVDQVFIHEDLPTRLLSPQAFLAHHKDGTRTGALPDHFRIYRDRSEWHLRGKKLLTLGYDRSFLPRITLFSKGEAIPTLKALSNVLHPSNQNLTPTQKIWQRWHFKLGHIAYSHIQKLALGSFLDRVSMDLLRTKIADHPKCSACQFGKQTRLPDETTTTAKREDHLGSLKEGQLKPGDRVFCDQLESRVRGRLLHTAGREPDKDRFCGATVFVDAASGYIHVEFQVTLNSTDSINALDSFERSSLHMGVSVNSYHADNGIFKSKRFVHEIMKNSQSIRYSGVGSKWQNGVSEGAISIIAS